MQALLEARAGLEATRSDGSTTLITASYMGHTEVVQALLGAGASLDPRDADGTALDNAIKQRRASPNPNPNSSASPTTLTLTLALTLILNNARRAPVEELLEAAHAERRAKTSARLAHPNRTPYPILTGGPA